MKDYIDYERLEKLSDGDRDVELYQKIIKLSGEVGELSQEFLAYDSSSNKSKTDLIEETCDVLNVAMDIFNKLTMYSRDNTALATKMFSDKLDKWEAKQNARNI